MTTTEQIKYTYEYDTCGVLCRHNDRDGGWEVLEPHCLNCGYPADDHHDDDCEWKDAPYIQDDTPAAEREWYKGEEEIYDKCEWCKGVMDKEYERSDRALLLGQNYDDFLATPQECPRCEYERQECLKMLDEEEDTEDEERDELNAAIDASGNALY